MAKKNSDAIARLDADHRSLTALFDEYRRLSGQKAGGAKRKALAEHICMELTIHMLLEEEIFDPPVRAALRDDDLLDAADVEHAGAKELVAQILGMKPDDELYDAKMTVLGEYLDHHVKQESQEIFPKLRNSCIDLALLGEQLRVRKSELRAVSPALREDARISVSA